MRYFSFARAGTAIIFTATIVLTDCTRVPSLEETTGTSNGKIFVNDVVARIKCELALAYADKPGQSNYAWLKDWTVKTDLSLQVNEQGGITPTLSYTQFQRSAANVGAGPASATSSALGLVQQSLTTSVNANIGAQMTATQAESFTMSLTELTAFRNSWAYLNFCKPAEGAGLIGNLRLKEWADASLSSVDAHILLAGKHKAPGSAGAAKPQVTGKPTGISGAGGGGATADELRKAGARLEDETKKKVLNDLVSLTAKANIDTISNLNAVSEAYGKAKENLDLANANLTNYTPISTVATVTELQKEVKTFRGLLYQAQNAKDCVLQQVCGISYGDCSTFGGRAVNRHYQNFELCDRVTCSLSNPSSNSGSKLEAACTVAARDAAFNNADLYDKMLGFAQDSSEAAKTNQTNSKTIADFAQGLRQKGVTTPDAPIDSISTTIQFEVAMGAGISPSWSLIYFKGPGISGPFVAATLNRTHILQIALGSPSQSANSTEQNRVLQNQILLLPSR
jgi:hypothetical protein